ncbi:unnamed protein product [Effrenium voratum]|uniref:Uncharacterized protein n=1 Tax=Effrenium voratum TaxID=2562239 RepID=A0AA36NKI1_9DINO|nr:unnamed protein product [Effrenium voratum]
MAFRVTYTDLAHRQRILASSLEPLRLVAVELFTLLAPSESDYLVPLAHCLTSLQAASPFFEHLELVFADLPEVWTSVPPMTLPQLLLAQPYLFRCCTMWERLSESLLDVLREIAFSLLEYESCQGQPEPEAA